MQGLVSADTALTTCEPYRAPASCCEKSFLLGVVFVAQRVHSGCMDSTHKQQGGTTMSRMVCSCGEIFLDGIEAGNHEIDTGHRCEWDEPAPEHSASRRVDVLREEAPHLFAADDVRRRVSVEIGDRIVIGDRSFVLDGRRSSDPLGVGRNDGDRYILREL